MTAWVKFALALVMALLYGGKGFALTELRLLDEAEAAYKASLKFEPGNKIAKGELAYVAGLKAGKSPSGAMLIMPNVKK